MPPRVRRRFWVELALAALSGLLLVLRLVRRDWVEAALGIDPDQGDGRFEWELLIGGLVATVTFSVVARLEWIQGRDVPWWK